MREANYSKKQLIASDHGFWFNQAPMDKESVSAYLGQKFKADGLEH